MKHYFRLAVLAVGALIGTSVSADEVRSDDMAAARTTHEEVIAASRRAQLALTPNNLVGPIMNGEVETVEALLSSGLDVNAKGSLSVPVLQLAASACAGKRLDANVVLAIIDVLLAHGAIVDIESPGGLNPLMVAAQQCPGSVVTRLLRAGADIEYRTPQGYTPLSMAIIVRNYDAAEALVEAGARLSPESAKKLLGGHEQDAVLVPLIRRATAK